MIDPLIKIISAHKRGKILGIYSVCSANNYVLEASIEQARLDNSPLLIESTSNQVNQYGGYTGKNPTDFYQFVKYMIDKQKFPVEKLILGGDHLGPNPWQEEKSDSAMAKAAELIKASIKAGYRKIHLDTSMRCLDDPGEPGTPFDADIVADRAAELCAVAENTVAEISQGGHLPLYVIGTDVPVPGGSRQELKEIHTTPIKEVRDTIQLTRQAFIKKGLESAWQRVIAVVVQPGVEFDDSSIFEYDRNKASKLSGFIEKHDNLVYEAHSTDYQKEDDLKKMVEDHFVILKVGPALTFAFREAVFNLAFIEKELLKNDKKFSLSNIQNVIERVMIRKPQYWQKYYGGNETSQMFARKYSFSDRLRYYWPQKEIASALNALITNLTERTIPLTLLSQFMPYQYHAVRNGELKNRPEALIKHQIMEVLGSYAIATGLSNFKSI